MKRGKFVMNTRFGAGGPNREPGCRRQLPATAAGEACRLVPLGVRVQSLAMRQKNAAPFRFRAQAVPHSCLLSSAPGFCVIVKKQG